MSKGEEIIKFARSCLGKAYGSSYNGHRMDCSGLVRYCLVKACGVSGSALGGGCKQQWEYFTSKGHKGKVLYQSSQYAGPSGSGKNIPTGSVKVGDLIYKFNYDNSGNHHVMIANGKGGTVDASGGSGVVREKQPYSWAYKDVDLWVRMEEDGSTPASTSSDLQEETNGPVPGSPAISSSTDSTGNPSGTDGSSSANVYDSTQYDYSYVLAGGLPLTSVDTYKGAMTKVLSYIKSSGDILVNGAILKGYSLGCLYDLTHGGSFRFILPEFSEQYSASYDAITIPGRSSDVQSYGSTPSPSRTVSLQLVAGEGLYVGDNPVDLLYRDISFVKSLCYPDYQTAIVKPPSIVLLYLGPESIIKGVVSTVSVNAKKPFTVEGKPMYVELSFTVVQATDNPADYKDVRERSTIAY